MRFCGSKMSLDATTEKPAKPLDTPGRSLVSSCRGTLPRALDTLKKAWSIIFNIFLRSTFSLLEFMRKAFAHNVKHEFV